MGRLIVQLAVFATILLQVTPTTSQATSKIVNSVVDSVGNPLNNILSVVEHQSLLKWTSTAFKFFDFHRCTTANLATEDQCFKLSSVEKSSVAIYVGRAPSKQNHRDNSNSKEQAYSILLGRSSPEISNGKMLNTRRNIQKVFAVLPDSNSVRASGAHDFILALDPYPNSNFGHFLGLFYVDFGVEARFCKEDHQIHSADLSCITVAKKPRCPNLLEKHTSGSHARRCHVDFLPTVHLAANIHPSIPGSSSEFYDYSPSSYSYSSDLMECMQLPGFATCPKLRSLTDTDKVLCDSTHSNSKRCDTSYTGVGTRCKLFQTCDRAVLVGGGWNRLHSGLQSLNNIFTIQDNLKKSGFLSENIKIFYANGKSPVEDMTLVSNKVTVNPGLNINDKVGEQTSEIRRSHSQLFSSAMKTGLRGHIRTICETRHCADSLFIYLNNPTTVEGDMLLWDVDYNGIADELEVYTAKEFVADISGCEAKRVVIVADQSHSDILMTYLKQSNDHQNVILYAAGLPHQITTNGELTNIWANSSRSLTSLRQLQEECNAHMKDSNPVVYDGSSGGSISWLSVVGAPCDLNPPLTMRELRSLYQGCQNVPTSVWFDFNLEGFTETEDDDDGESDENSPNGRRGQ